MTLRISPFYTRQKLGVRWNIHRLSGCFFCFRQFLGIKGELLYLRTHFCGFEDDWWVQGANHRFFSIYKVAGASCYRWVVHLLGGVRLLLLMLGFAVLHVHGLEALNICGRPQFTFYSKGLLIIMGILHFFNAGLECIVESFPLTISSLPWWSPGCSTVLDNSWWTIQTM